MGILWWADCQPLQMSLFICSMIFFLTFQGVVQMERHFWKLFSVRCTRWGICRACFFGAPFRRIDLSAFVECRKWQRMLTAIIVIIAVKKTSWQLCLAIFWWCIAMYFAGWFRTNHCARNRKEQLPEELEVHLKQYHAVPISDYIRLSTCICFRIVE